MAASALVPANPGVLDGAPDLTGLTYLNEPSILHGLHLRYADDAIYTHAGPVLIALNPFRTACPCMMCQHVIAIMRQWRYEAAVALHAFCQRMPGLSVWFAC